ncbi:MAG: Txe/YoeB family addiction module toxin [Prevotellaceae bacterium]|jgi:toxin YoeB|nr:Txe/YoeB family addiction module toxin [Prevotellaceae bacterium]
MTYKLVFTKNAYTDIERLRKSGDKKTLEKLDNLLTELRQHPRSGTGKPKMLSGNKMGTWSRRLTDKHRLRYIINDHLITVTVIGTYGHYEDK